MLLSEITTKCKGCEKELKVFSGMEEVSIVDKHVILPLCQKCSQKIRKFIKELMSPK